MFIHVDINAVVLPASRPGLSESSSYQMIIETEYSKEGLPSQVQVISNLYTKNKSYQRIIHSNHSITIIYDIANKVARAMVDSSPVVYVSSMPKLDMHAEGKLMSPGKSVSRTASKRKISGRDCFSITEGGHSSRQESWYDVRSPNNLVAFFSYDADRLQYSLVSVEQRTPTISDERRLASPFKSVEEHIDPARFEKLLHQYGYPDSDLSNGE